jgi:hypothetical protein
MDNMNSQIDDYVKSIGEQAGTDGTKEFEDECGISIERKICTPG